MPLCLCEANRHGGCKQYHAKVFSIVSSSLDYALKFLYEQQSSGSEISTTVAQKYCGARPEDLTDSFMEIG
jgi:hypothetical protein